MYIIQFINQKNFNELRWNFFDYRENFLIKLPYIYLTYIKCMEFNENSNYKIFILNATM